MKHSTPWKGMDKKEAQDHKLLEISALLEDYLEHHLDVITDSEWFADLVEEKVKKLLIGEEQKRGINRD